jgi:cyclophilin family peptidyl-prolyl cis-trans isomerase
MLSCLPDSRLRAILLFLASLSVLGASALDPAQKILARQDEQKSFDEAVEKWRATLKKAAEAFAELEYADQQQFIVLRDQLINLKAQGDAERREVIFRGAKLYRALPENNENLRTFLEGMDLYAQYEYGLAAEVKAALHSRNPTSVEHHFNALKSAFFANNFEFAQNLLEQWKPLHGDIPPEVEALGAALTAYRQRWTDLQAEIAARPAGHVNPLLSFTTSMGNIVIELDEDRYPVIVGNIVDMVEKSQMYRGSGLFEIVEHQRVRGGCPQNNGTTAIPVARINPEIMKNAQMNYRGTFSLMIDPQQARVTSQFVISRSPGVDLEGAFLPVGRVVAGMEIVDRLPKTHKLNDELEIEKIEGVEPETISESAITKKRDHEYNRSDDAQNSP